MSAREEFRPWPEDPRYQVGDHGTVVGPRGWPLRPWVTDTGYRQLHVKVDGQRRGRTVHIMVCEAWHGPRPEGMEVAHANGNRLDNRATNLSWKSRADNHLDKRGHGTAQWGVRHHNHRLTEEAVRAIRASSVSLSALAAKYGVSKSCVHAARSGRSWRHLA